MDESVYFQNLHDYVEHLDDTVKASEELYEQRLSICKQCDYLQEGMCRACGCFVELRAAIGTNVCSYNKW